MPTSNPRLTITLEPRLAAQLRLLSTLTGNSQSKLISEMLEGSSGVLDRVIRVLEAAELAKAEMKGNVARDMAHAQQRIEVQLGLSLEEEQEVTDSLLAGVEAVHRRGRRAPVRQRDEGARAHGVPAVATPLSNRGVRSGRSSRKTGGL